MEEKYKMDECLFVHHVSIMKINGNVWVTIKSQKKGDFHSTYFLKILFICCFLVDMWSFFYKKKFLNFQIFSCKYVRFPRKLAFFRQYFFSSSVIFQDFSTVFVEGFNALLLRYTTNGFTRKKISPQHGVFYHKGKKYIIFFSTVVHYPLTWSSYMYWAGQVWFLANLEHGINTIMRRNNCYLQYFFIKSKNSGTYRYFDFRISGSKKVLLNTFWD